MKILAIRGSNLASLEGEFEIDFMTEPLASAGIFAITGATGAGKSTILDALCVALFDNTPRTDFATENLQIIDVDNKTISQKDSRNILRRGVAEGYAEVDFIALNGEKYRSRWMVRRAYNKALGALQSSEIRLHNLSTQREEQGTKTELLERIKKLTGLNFDQFTRAVLLAQGDFATFLKAKQSEKAELLEKLTGTEVYSEISTIIYKKTKDAEGELHIINERIKDVHLLSDEEKGLLNIESEELQKTCSNLKKELAACEKKGAWLEHHEQLLSELEQIEKKRNEAKLRIEEAKPRYEYVSLLDLFQEIRDEYVRLAHNKTQLSNYKEEIFSRKKQQVDLIEKQGNIKQVLQSIKNRQEECELQFEAIFPDIKKSKDLDITIFNRKENLKKLEKDFENITIRKQQAEQKKRKLEQQINAEKTIEENLNKWFDENRIYSDIIPRIDLLIVLSDDANNSLTQGKKSAESLDNNKSLQFIYKQKLEQYQNEFERLNGLLPNEVLALRAKLEDGKPCPVCGSIHHNLQDKNTDSSGIDERDLEQSKVEILEHQKHIEDKILDLTNEITRQETLIMGYREQYKEAVTKIGNYLTALHGWKEKLHDGELPNALRKIENLWNRNLKDLNESLKQKEICAATLDTENSALSQIESEYISQKDNLDAYRTNLQKIEDDRRLLLNGKETEIVEQEYQNRIKNDSFEYDSQNTIYEKLTFKLSETGGIISQIQKSIQEIETQNEILENKIEIWLNKNPGLKKNNTIDNLASVSREWILKEKEILNSLENNKILLQTRLQEKQIQIASFLLSDNKPKEGETAEYLQQIIQEKENSFSKTSKRLSEIEVVLELHRTGEKKVAEFKKELDKTNKRYEDWYKLNDLFGSADGSKFKKIAQGYTLDILLIYANEHLNNLTKRYKLERIPNTLALQVMDMDMLGEMRTVHSLSGGESFLISLSLALGLSSLSSNKLKIESLFIDEGFGSLDLDTLSIAMDALENLQTQGRKIGVISHVAEMTERIAAQIQIVKTSKGRSEVRIKSSKS